MNFWKKLIGFFGRVEDELLSNHACISCRREILDGSNFQLCEKCLSSINLIDGNLCEKCGDIVFEGNKICDRCSSAELNFDKSRSFAFYDGTAKNIIKRFKYGSKKYYAEYVSKLMLKNKEYFENVDVITFVPIGKKRLKERGFNQAEEIALNISKLIDKPVLNLLEKIGDEKHQAGLSQKSRMENIKNSFKLKDEDLSLIKGKNILLIDDVYTTGATLSECSRTLKSSKKFMPKKVFCYTFAKTEYNSSKNNQKIDMTNK